MKMKTKTIIIACLFLLGWTIIIDTSLFLEECEYLSYLSAWKFLFLFLIPYLISIACVGYIMWKMISKK